LYSYFLCFLVLFHPFTFVIQSYTGGANKYFGLRANFQWFKEDVTFSSSKIYAGSIDLINRWDFINKKKFRLWGELGISAKRHVEFQEEVYGNCFCLPPLVVGITPIVHKWSKGNQLGFSSGLGIDYNIFKAINIGMNFTLKKYASNKNLIFHASDHLSSLNIFLGYKF